MHRGTPLEHADHAKALRLAIAGLENGDYDRLAYVWEKTFCLMPLGQSGERAVQERALQLLEALIPEAPRALRPIYEQSLRLTFDAMSRRR